LTSKTHTMRNLVIIGSALIALGETAYLTILFSPLGGSTAPWVFLFAASFWLLLTSKDRFWKPIFPSWARLIQHTHDPHRTSLWVHWAYSFLVFLNTLVLMISFFAILVTKTWSPNWAFLAGTSAILLVYYDRLVLGGLGQQSEDNSGSSFVLAAACASLSVRMFSRHNRDGISPLLQAIRIAGILFYRRRYGPKLLPAVQTTIEGLIDLEADQLPFSELETLASSLTLLPRREGLQPAFEKFLSEMKWPGGFEGVERKQMSNYELVTIVVLALGAFGSLLVVIPQTVQSGFYDQVVSLVSPEAWSILGGAILIVGIFYGIVAAKYEAYFRLLIRGSMSGEPVTKRDGITSEPEPKATSDLIAS